MELRLDSDGTRCVKTLQKLAKEAIRRGLAEGGFNIKPKVESLEYPGRLKNYLCTMDQYE